MKAIQLESIYSCESRGPCDHAIPNIIYNELGPWRAEHDNDDLFIVHKNCAGKHEIMYALYDYRVIRDRGRLDTWEAGS